MNEQQLQQILQIQQAISAAATIAVVNSILNPQQAAAAANPQQQVAVSGTSAINPATLNAFLQSADLQQQHQQQQQRDSQQSPNATQNSTSLNSSPHAQPQLQLQPQPLQQSTSPLSCDPATRLQELLLQLQQQTALNNSNNNTNNNSNNDISNSNIINPNAAMPAVCALLNSLSSPTLNTSGNSLNNLQSTTHLQPITTATTTPTSTPHAQLNTPNKKLKRSHHHHQQILPHNGSTSHTSSSISSPLATTTPTSATAVASLHNVTPQPRKLVRGQDVWLGKGAEQTRQILKCMWCGVSFKALGELSQHMRITNHHANIISQEQISSWRQPADNPSSSSKAASGKAKQQLPIQAKNHLEDNSSHELMMMMGDVNEDSDKEGQKKMNTKNQESASCGEDFDDEDEDDEKDIADDGNNDKSRTFKRVELGSGEDEDEGDGDANKHRRRRRKRQRRHSSSSSSSNSGSSKSVKYENNPNSDSLEGKKQNDQRSSRASDNKEAKSLSIEENTSATTTATDKPSTCENQQEDSVDTDAEIGVNAGDEVEDRESSKDRVSPNANSQAKSAKEENNEDDERSNCAEDLIFDDDAKNKDDALADDCDDEVVRVNRIDNLDEGHTDEDEDENDKETSRRRRSQRLNRRRVDKSDDTRASSATRTRSNNSKLVVQENIGSVQQQQQQKTGSNDSSNRCGETGDPLSALETMVEKSFDPRLRPGVANGGILQRLGIDEEVCPPWQHLNYANWYAAAAYGHPMAAALLAAGINLQNGIKLSKNLGSKKGDD